MKKAGVITIVKDAVDESFGPAVQILAVQKYLKKYDIEAETIIDNNNRRNFIQNVFRGLDEFKNGKGGLKLVLLKLGIISNGDKAKTRDKALVEKLIKERRLSYGEFIDKYVKISDLTEEDLYLGNDKIKKYDYFVVGSDQVWNPYYPQLDRIKYLQFCEAKKRVAFSPSIAREDIPKRFIKRFKDGVSGFNNISVREEKGREIIKKYTGLDASVLLDPTMLIDVDFWKSIEKKSDKMPKKKYLVSYFMGNCNRKIIEKFAEKRNLEIVWLRDFDYPEYYKFNPMEYMYLIDNADLVCTDSFHMSVFSILLRKKFVVFERDATGVKGMGSRLSNLLNKFDLNDRYFDGNVAEKYFEMPKFDKVDEVLSIERRKASEFFDKIFKE